MNREDIGAILRGLPVEGGDALTSWCREHLPGVLKQAGVSTHPKPYAARVSDRVEEYLHTWESGQKAMLKRRFMEVYETATGNVLGEVEIGTWKSLNPICEPVKRGDQWYFLAAKGGIQLYSLPDMALVAETKAKMYWGKVTDIYCPRIHTELYEFKHGDEECAAYICVADDDIESGQDWDSALFAFVESYDPYCSGPDYVRMLDLRDFSDGELRVHECFAFEKPSRLSLRACVNMEDWSKEWPRVDIAMYECYSTVDGKGPEGNGGWAHGQLDYFAWAGEQEDPRTSHSRSRQRATDWADSEACKYLTERLGVEYDPKFYDHVHSEAEAVELAESDPARLKTIALHNFRNGAQINSAYATYGLSALPPSDGVREVLRYIAKHTKVSCVRDAAKRALREAYPNDPVIKRFSRFLGVSK